jgi:hypothetical protein
MSSNCIFFGWNRPVTGRETLSAQHFQEFNEYLAVQQRTGAIASYEVVFLDPHGGDLNGFFLIRGEAAKLAALQGTDEWIAHQVRGTIHLQGLGILRGVTGAEVPRRMQLWTQSLPKS